MKSQEWVLAVGVVVVVGVLAMVAWIKAPEAPLLPTPTPTPTWRPLWPPTPLPPSDCRRVPEDIRTLYADAKLRSSGAPLSWSFSNELWYALRPDITHNEAKQMYKDCLVTGRRY